jgi:hypothetical protein
MSNKRKNSKKSTSSHIASKDLKVKFRHYNRKEKAIRVIAGIITMIFIIILILLIVLSIINQQYGNIVIYGVLIGFAIIPNEIIERIFKNNAQKRIINQLIEKKVEIEKIHSKHISTIDKAREEGQEIIVFVSYATKDADIYKIRDLAKNLTKYEKINDVLYWQEDMKDNIIKYMNDNLGKCDVMLLFCSPNALASEPVEKEWTAADIIGKPIIPIFNNPDHIPTLLKARLGVQFDPFDFQKNINEIYSLILKKIE